MSSLPFIAHIMSSLFKICHDYTVGKLLSFEVNIELCKLCELDY